MGTSRAVISGKDNSALLNALLKLDLFPIKDSYVTYLKRDKSVRRRNPNTVDRLCGRLYEMGLEKFTNVPLNRKKQIGKLDPYLNVG